MGTRSLTSLSLCTAFALTSAQPSFAVTPEPRTNLSCKMKSPSERSEIRVQIREIGRVSRSDIEAGVPETFLEDMEGDDYFLRKFIVSGSLDVKRDSEVISEKLEAQAFYGNLSLPIPDEGLTETAAFSDYDRYKVRAMRLEIEEGEIVVRLSYGSGNYTIPFRLTCSGELPSGESVRKPQPELKPFHRAFTCSLKGKAPLADFGRFSFTVRNLHQPRMLERKVVERSDGTSIFVFGDRVSRHPLNVLNGGDSSIGQSGSGSARKLVLRGDEDGVEFGTLALDYPDAATTQTKGPFKYKDPEGRQLSGTVTCTLSAAK